MIGHGVDQSGVNALRMGSATEEVAANHTLPIAPCARNLEGAQTYNAIDRGVVRRRGYFSTPSKSDPGLTSV